MNIGVIGAGVFGLASAIELRARGADAAAALDALAALVTRSFDEDQGG